MAGSAGVPNPLLSTQKSSLADGLQISLHPLPVLEISDHITRAYMRGQDSVVVGGLLGQQHGRAVSIEGTFSCLSRKKAAGLYEIDEPFFSTRLEEMRTIHKNPPLELVGWYSLVNKSGPTEAHLSIHSQITASNETPILLGFHIDDIITPTARDLLPLTVYESNMEAEGDDEPAEGEATAPAAAAGEDREMKDLDAAAGAATKMVLKFRELPYTTESGEAEMIAMQAIKEGVADATAAGDETEQRISEQFDKKIAVDGGKRKRRAVHQEEASSSTKTATITASLNNLTTSPLSNKDANLSRADAEAMAAMQARASAIKMMLSRLNLVIAYLERLPPEFVAGKQTAEEAAAAATATDLAAESSPASPTTIAAESATSNQTAVTKMTTATVAPPSHRILRLIQALVTNIGLASPARQRALETEILRETNDVELVALVTDLLGSLDQVRDVGNKFHLIETARAQRMGRTGPDGGGGGGGLTGPMTTISRHLQQQQQQQQQQQLELEQQISQPQDGGGGGGTGTPSAVFDSIGPDFSFTSMAGDLH